MESAKKNILIVDDEVDLRDLLSMMFESADLQSEVASSGKEAIEKLRSQKFDLVLADLRMPQGNGIDILKWVRSNQNHLPVILMPGVSDRTDKELVAAGADGIFEKPFDQETLLEFVNSVFDSNNTRKSLRNFPRISVRLRTKIFLPEQGMALEGFTFNIGKGGIFFAMKNPPNVHGVPVEFQIMMGEGSERVIKGVGLIKWVRTQSVHGKHPGIGIEFSQVDPDGIKLLNSLI